MLSYANYFMVSSFREGLVVRELAALKCAPFRIPSQPSLESPESKEDKDTLFLALQNHMVKDIIFKIILLATEQSLCTLLKQSAIHSFVLSFRQY